MCDNTQYLIVLLLLLILTSIFEFLLVSQADPGIQDAEGRTPLIYAVVSHAYDCVKVRRNCCWHSLSHYLNVLCFLVC